MNRYQIDTLISVFIDRTNLVSDLKNLVYRLRRYFDFGRDFKSRFLLYGKDTNTNDIVNEVYNVYEKSLNRMEICKIGRSTDTCKNIVPEEIFKKNLKLFIDENLSSEFPFSMPRIFNNVVKNFDYDRGKLISDEGKETISRICGLDPVVFDRNPYSETISVPYGARDNCINNLYEVIVRDHSPIDFAVRDIMKQIPDTAGTAVSSLIHSVLMWVIFACFLSVYGATVRRLRVGEIPRVEEIADEIADERADGRRKSARRKSARRKSARRKSARRKSAKRKSARRKSAKRKSARRKSARRKSARRKSARRKSAKRKSAKRKSTRRKSTRR
jgi:hypothetical protein